MGGRGGHTKKKISCLENSRMFWEGTSSGGIATDTTELGRERPESLGGVMIKAKYVTCGQDRRLLFWETRLTHCVCPQADTLKNAPASFTPREQGSLCLTSLASAMEAAGELVTV